MPVHKVGLELYFLRWLILQGNTVR